jgi:hypothetical protein
VNVAGCIDARLPLGAGGDDFHSQGVQRQLLHGRIAAIAASDPSLKAAVARSWTRVWPPASRISLRPFAPSPPIPFIAGLAPLDERMIMVLDLAIVADKRLHGRKAV